MSFNSGLLSEDIIQGSNLDISELHVFAWYFIWVTLLSLTSEESVFFKYSLCSGYNTYIYVVKGITHCAQCKNCIKSLKKDQG